jgi:hypothetical protein
MGLAHSRRAAVNQVNDTTCPAPDGGTDAGPKDAAGE